MKNILAFFLLVFFSGSSYAGSTASDLWVVQSATGVWDHSELCLPVLGIKARYFTDRPIRKTGLVTGKMLVAAWDAKLMPNIILFAHYENIKIQDENIAIIKQRSDDQQWCLTLDQFKGKSQLPSHAQLDKVTLLIGG